MRRLIATAILVTLAACSPPPPSEHTQGTAPTPANADWGPYSNSWDSDEFSTFAHTLNAATPGPHEVTLSAQTSSPGGETVAVYPISPDGDRMARIMFVAASTRGETRTEVVEFPADGANVPVQVIVENASGNRYSGSYTLAVAP